jgi:hypothetical protein
MTCRAWGFCFIVTATIVALPGLAAGARQRPRSVLEGAPGLEKRVTYSETKIPLGELVARVAAETGVSLRAARDVADEPVAVVVREIPARELLDQVADLLDYRWSRRSPNAERPTTNAQSTHAPRGNPTPAFEIWQDLASKQREEALRRAAREAVEQQFQKELQSCQELAALSQDEIQRLVDAAYERDQRLEKLSPEERQALLNSPEEKERSRRYGAAQHLSSPIDRSLAGLTARLSPEQWTALRAGRQLVFASDPRPGELPLSADVLRTFRTSQPRSDLLPTAVAAAHPELVEQIDPEEKEMQERWAAADGYHVTIRFTPNYPKAGWIVFNAISAPVRGGQRMGPLTGSPIFVLNIKPEDAQSPETANPQRRVRLEQDPLLGARKPFRPEGKPGVQASSPQTSRTVRRLPDLLPDLARTYGVDFIADSYWTAPRIDEPLPGPEPAALFVLLDRCTGRSAVWDRRGTLIRVRSRNWFLDRPSEIPLRFVRRWADLCDRLGALPLEEYASIATLLSDAQIDSLDGMYAEVFLPQPLQDLTDVAVARHLLRLYAALLPGQQQALRQGRRLLLAQISPGCAHSFLRR